MTIRIYTHRRVITHPRIGRAKLSLRIYPSKAAQSSIIEAGMEVVQVDQLLGFFALIEALVGLTQEARMTEVGRYGAVAE